MRFKIEPSKSKPNFWVCSDFQNKIVCIFENEKFNETQQFELLEDIIPLEANVLAKAANEMGDWLSQFHYCKTMPDGNVRIRIGQRIRELRTESGLTLRELAEQTGLTYPNLSNIENGKYDIRLDTIAKLEAVFKKKIDFI